jgi:hypothetical protein
MWPFLALIRFDVDEREESIWAWAVSLVLLSCEPCVTELWALCYWATCNEKEVESRCSERM